MHSTPSLIHELERDYPQFSFIRGDDFQWSPHTRSITYQAKGTVEELLHEVGHALIGHATYSRDIELLRMEREAWSTAEKLAPHYKLSIDSAVIEAALDSYRDWLHARSTCPTCSATGLEVKKHHYRCPACLGEWQVNEARICGLRRHKL